MIILDVKISNLACFNDFHINFVTNKKFYKNSFVEPVLLPNSKKVYYKTINIIMGANASGKTIFGELLMRFQSLLRGNAASYLINLNDKSKNSIFESIFAIEDKIFQYTIKSDVRDGKLDVTESIKVINYKENQTWNQILNKLEKERNFYTYYLDVEDGIFVSDLIKQKPSNEILSKYESYQSYFKEHVRAFYAIKGLFGIKYSYELEDYSIELLDKLLKIVDSNITGVSRVSKDDLEGFYIHFKHNKKIIMRNIMNVNDGLEGGLSLGTIEALYLIFVLSIIHRSRGIIYIDEQMAYMHTNLSNALVYQLIDKMDKKSQLFITTHNENVLDLRLPISSFMFFKKEEDNITVINPEKLEKSTTKNLKFNVQSNFYGTYPENIDEIWDLEYEETK